MRRKLLVLGVALAAFGGASTALGYFSDARRASFSYLFAFACVFTVVNGALFLLLIGHASNAKWFIAVRRLAEHVVGAFPAVCVLLAPVLLAMKQLYPWTDLSRLEPPARRLIEKKTAWLNEPAFVWRSVGYLAVLLVVGELLRSWSLRQDGDATLAIPLRRRMIALSAGGLPLVSLIVTFASFDWFMSLEPTWYSDVYGVYIFAGGFLSALGLFGAMLVVAASRNELPRGVSAEHFSAVGRLMLAMVIFWTYIGWAQLVLQWIADLPLEVTWYLARWAGGWQWFGLALLVLHWAVPFFYLLQRGLKRRPVPFVAISVWLVAVHLLDVYYLILPAYEPKHFAFHWLDATAVVALSGAVLAFAAWRAGGVAPYPSRDPFLDQSIRYEAA
jgi:hypothetical protein